MFIFSIIVLIGFILIGAILFVDCKIVDDLPESNEFKKWWKKHIIGPHPKD